MQKIIIDPEFKAVNRALTPEEYGALRSKIRAEGAKEPLWLGSGPLGETLLDGYNRTGIYEELQIFDYPMTHAPVETREDAINWIIDHQLGRRNLNREERNYLIGKRYLREKAQGRKAVDGKTTAERLGEGEAMHEKTIRRAAEFTKAVDTIAENVGETARQEIRQGAAKMSADTVAEVAKQPPAKQREAYAKAKGTKSKPKREVPPAVVEAALDAAVTAMAEQPESEPPAGPRGLELMAVKIAVENAKAAGIGADPILSAVHLGLTGVQMHQGAEWDLSLREDAKPEPAPKRKGGRPKLPRCAGCGKAIKEMVVTYASQPYHQDCAGKAAS